MRQGDKDLHDLHLKNMKGGNFEISQYTSVDFFLPYNHFPRFIRFMSISFWFLIWETMGACEVCEVYWRPAGEGQGGTRDHPGAGQEWWRREGHQQRVKNLRENVKVSVNLSRFETSFWYFPAWGIHHPKMDGWWKTFSSRLVFLFCVLHHHSSEPILGMIRFLGRKNVFDFPWKCNLIAIKIGSSSRFELPKETQKIAIDHETSETIISNLSRWAVAW